MITPEQWRRVQELCEQLEACPDSVRPARLRELEIDDTVQRETLALLAALREEETARRAVPPAAPVVQPAPERVGGVRLLERLGAGGSGEVYRGVRQVNGATQAVAVKLFHAFRDDAEHRARIAREQQMLATLTHPDIVGLIDAGVTSDGRPYLVMDLVEGEPITAWSDARRLDPRARIRLFLQVCAAVRAAHRQLVVHLDLKPSNILVAADGRVKLLDFGTAKLAEPGAAFTRTEPLTLRYASPERLRGEPVSVACDVYSLGLIFYELLSGGWPFRTAESLVSVAERAAGHLDAVPLPRVVAEDAAERRGTTAERLRAALRGDLEAIAARALAHDPRSRYASVSELADDLARYLDGEPVRAQVQGARYRLRKFVRRHAWAVASATLLVVGLATAAVYSTVQARSARQAASRLEVQNRFLASVFTLAGADGASRAGMTVRELLALAEQRIAPTLGARMEVAADVELALARGYVSQGAFDQARRLLDGVVARASTAGDVPREAASRAMLAYVAYVGNDNLRALAEARAALAAWRAAPGRFTPAQAATMLSTAGNTLSYVALSDPDVRPAFDACLDLARAHPDAVDSSSRALCLRGLAIADTNVDSRYADAVTRLEEAVAIQRADPGAASDLSSTLQMLGLAHRYQGHYAEDEAAQRESLDLIARLGGADSIAALWQRAVWATSLVGVGRVDDAGREALEVLAAARKAYPNRGSYLLWTPLSAAASAVCLGEDAAACEALAREAIETLGPSPADDDPRLAHARGLVGLALARQGRRDEARALLEAALAQQAARRRVSPFTTVWEEARQGS
jgi:eukaryotic-like serine/threonine-protein kinase